jgi:hypothetical protein
MKIVRYTTAILLLSSAFNASSQYEGMELVRNGTFDEVNKLPGTYDQFSFATGWKNVTLGLSELFDRKASSKTVGIPVNDYGTMEPFEGERYAGFMGWKDDVRSNFNAADQDELFKPGWNSYSEYLQGELVSPLEKGAIYEISFQVALAGNSDRAIMGLGALAWKDPQPYRHRKFMEEVPDVFMEEILTERQKWTEVRGTFKAQGGEEVIVIGVFPYVGMESERIIEGPDNRYAYYYVDAVSMKRVPDEN